MKQTAAKTTEQVEVKIKLKNNKIMGFYVRAVPKVTNELLMTRITRRKVPEIINNNYTPEELK